MLEGELAIFGNIYRIKVYEWGKMNIKKLPMDERPREKLLVKGAASLSDAELLAILLRTGTKEMSAIELASHLLYNNKNGLRGLAFALPEELCQMHGIGKAKACELAAALELGKRLHKKEAADEMNRITCSRQAADYLMEELRYYKKETFNAILVDCKGKVISMEQVSVGDMTSAPVHPRELFNPAVRKNAYAMILAHNHPSGEVSPSREDIMLTERMVEVGKLLGIKVSDHIIIGDGTYYSFKDNGLL